MTNQKKIKQNSFLIVFLFLLCLLLSVLYREKLKKKQILIYTDTFFSFVSFSGAPFNVRSIFMQNLAQELEKF